MKLKHGHMVHFGSDKLNWIALFENNKWYICRKIHLGQSPTCSKNYEIVQEVAANADVHLHAYALAFPPQMLYVMLNT